MFDEFKQKLLDGFYADHIKGKELLDLDLEAIEIVNDGLNLENKGLIMDNKQLKEEYKALVELTNK